MEIRKIQSFLGSTWGIFSTGTVFFPFFDQVTNLVYVPAINEQDKLVLITVNSLICAFTLLFFFLIQYQKNSLTLTFILFIGGIGTFLGYEYLVSPIETLKLLGISADITYLSGYPILLYKILYWGIFAFFTGAFTSLAAFFYRSQNIVSTRW